MPENDTVERDNFIEELKAFAYETLQPRVALIVSALEDHLFNLSASAQFSSDQRTRCFEAFSAIKAQQRSIIRDFHRHVEEGYRHIQGQPPEDSPQSVFADELNLVDLQEFENDLAIKKIVKAGSERFWLPIEAMTLRVAEALHIPPADVSLPFGLSGLCHAYRFALKNQQFPAFVLTELDRAFARNLIPELALVYQAINRFLIERELLPDIEKELETQGSRLERARSDQHAPTPAQQSTSHAASKPLPTPAAQRGDGHPLNALPRGAELPLSDQNPSPLMAYSAQEALQERQQALDAFESARGELISPQYLPGQGLDIPNTTVAPATLARLTQGQGYRDTASPSSLGLDEWHRNAAALGAQIAQLRRSSPNPERLAAPLTSQLKFDDFGAAGAALQAGVAMVDSVYQTLNIGLSDNPKLSSSFNQLKLPLAELSLSDPSFFMNREHPARLLIERLTELGALAPPNNPRIERQLDELLGEVARDFDGHDLAVFDHALAKVTDLALQQLKQQQRNIRHHVAAEEGKERRQEAAKETETALVNQLNDLQLPRSIITLVDVLWRDMLILLHIKGQTGGISSSLRAIRNASEALIVLASKDYLRAAPDAQILVEDLYNACQGTDFLTPEQDAALGVVETQLRGLDAVELVDSTVGSQEIYEEPWFSERLERLPRLRYWVRKARDIPVNSWLKDKKGTSGRTVQLIWHNASRTRFAFANERGQKIKDTDLVGFASWLHHGLSPLAPSEQLSVIEKSVYSSLTDVQSSLIADSDQHARYALNRDQLCDALQALLRRARRKGISHSAITLHTEDHLVARIAMDALTDAGLEVEAEGALSDSTRGILVASGDLEMLQTLLKKALTSADHTGVAIESIDPQFRDAELLWNTLEHTAQRGLLISPNLGMKPEQYEVSRDLAGAIRQTYSRLREQMPPIISFQRIIHQNVDPRQGDETMYQILLDGASELPSTSGLSYNSPALTVALDCLKVHYLCRQAETLVSNRQQCPLFTLRISTESSTHHDFLDFVLNEVSSSGLGTDRICLEFKDSSRLREEVMALEFARTLRNIGCKIGITHVHPARGNTSELQALCPHYLELDNSLWPPKEGGKGLHQAISDLHHLVGEHVGLASDSLSVAMAQELGLDFVTTFQTPHLSESDFLAAMPQLPR
jgi:hypothetical protein